MGWLWFSLWPADRVSVVLADTPRLTDESVSSGQRAPWDNRESTTEPVAYTSAPALQYYELPLESWMHRPVPATMVVAESASEATASNQTVSEPELRICQLPAESWMHQTASPSAGFPVAAKSAQTDRTSEVSSVTASAGSHPAEASSVAASAGSHPAEASSVAASAGSHPAEASSAAASTGSHRLSSVAAVSARGREYIRYGFDLGERGALYVARETLVQALRLIAEALDADSQTQEHCAALDAGLRALREADDFASASEQGVGEVDLRLLSAAHRTPVLKGQNMGRVDAVGGLAALLCLCIGAIDTGGRA